jgi:hypothetical protein
MKLLKILGLVGLVIVATIATLFWAISPHEPSDQALEQQFYRNRPDLERLVAMLAEDPQMIRIAPSFLLPRDSSTWNRPDVHWSITQARWDLYRSLFDRAGIADGVVSNATSNEVILLVYTWGIVPAGVSVGYIHCGEPNNGNAATEPACIERKDSGEGMYGKSTSYGYRYKKITGDWFILERYN